MSYFNNFFADDYYAANYWGPTDQAASVSKLYGCLYLGLYANIYVKPAF